VPLFMVLAASAAASVNDAPSADTVAAATAPITIEEYVAPFDPGRTGFTITTPDGIEVGFEEFALFVRPGQQLDLIASTPVRWSHEETALGDGEARLSLDWSAPDDPGHHHLVATSESGETMHLHLVVMRRREAGDDAINGFRSGEYPAEPYRGQDNYRAPEYFVEVGEGVEDIPLSPHFRLGQFLCKQESGEGPEYLVVSERLVVKLENILEAANENGWRTDGFTVMSGYRTPAYNAGLGNGRHSRHIYGGAADIFIDTDGNGVMDDLNGDGRLDRQDAAALYDLVDGMAASGHEDWRHGGLGEYGPNAYHGAFVHVDERGWRARWGRS
jgi:hypothetical protein